MDLETQTPETKEQTTPEVQTQPAGDMGTQQSSDQVEPQKTGSEIPTIEAQAAAWMPDFKFKVKDREMEFDDFVKPIIKTKELQEKMKDLYLKAHGLDEVKADRETLKTSLKEEREKFTNIESNLKNLGTYVKNKDFRTFFDVLNIPKDQIIQYAIEELKYQELPPEQRQAIEQQRQMEAEFKNQQTQNQTLQSQMQQMVVNQARFELTQALSSQDVVSSIQNFDARIGKPGAFEMEVIKLGQYYEAVHKSSPPASQLVQEVLNLVGLNSGHAGQQNQVPQQQGNVSQVVHNQNQKPVIPSFSGGSVGKSPVRQLPNSIDDLRRIRQERMAQT